MTKATIRNKGCARPQLGTSPSKALQHRDIVELLNHKCFQYSHVFPALPRVGADCTQPVCVISLRYLSGDLKCWVLGWRPACIMSGSFDMALPCTGCTAYDILWHHPVNADETIHFFIWTLLMGDLLGNWSAQWTDFRKDVRLSSTACGLCLGFTYIWSSGHLHNTVRRKKAVCWNATFMVMICMAPRLDTLSEFQLPARSGPDVCTAFVGEVLADEIPPDQSTKSGKWFASRFDGRDLHCPSRSEFQAIHCWT